jgi:hypothetical protein
MRSKSPWKSIGGGNRIRNCITTYMNPFSTATAIPKIPDGKSSFSTGVRLQNVQPVRNDAEQDMKIYIFPGLTSGCYVSGDDRLNFDYPPTTAVLATEAGVANHEGQPIHDDYWTGRRVGSLYSRHIEIPQGFYAFDTDVVNYNTAGIPIKKWRVVSQATKIMLTNNYDNNEGWFEAFRTVAEPSEFRVQSIEKLPVATPCATWAAVDALNRAHYTFGAIPDTAKIDVNNIVEHPSYVSGKLRDIGKYVFQLKPVNNHHEFLDLGDEIKRDHSLIDRGYDMIVIVIHGRPGGNANVGSALVVHTVSNQEIIYDENNVMARFHSESVKDLASLSRAQSALQYSQKAAKRLLAA